MESNFFQANFWGIMGTVSGALGLIISWLNWRYSKPRITIAELTLVLRPKDKVKEGYKGKTEEQLRNHLMSFELKIRLRNKKGGSGAIEKPYLVISIPKKGEKNLFWYKPLEIKLKPRTTHVEHTQISSSTYNSEVIRHGEAWNFGGGQIVDDELEYRTQNTKDLFNIVTNYENLKFSIEYHNNFGRKFRREIKSFEDDM